MGNFVDMGHLADTKSSAQLMMTLMVVVSATGILWSIMLLRKARDWRMGLLTVLMGLVPIYQTVALFTETGILTVTAAAQIRAFVDLTINVLFLIAVFLLEFALEERRSVQLQLRVLEEPLMIEKPQGRSFKERLQRYARRGTENA
jgi:hypothetical protein